MTDQEIYTAYAMMTRLEVQAGEAWLNCVIQKLQTDTSGIREVRLMILDPQGWPTDIPAQDLSKHNFGRLRKKYTHPSGASLTKE